MQHNTRTKRKNKRKREVRRSRKRGYYKLRYGGRGEDVKRGGVTDPLDELNRIAMDLRVRERTKSLPARSLRIKSLPARSFHMKPLRTN